MTLKTKIQIMLHNIINKDEKKNNTSLPYNKLKEWLVGKAVIDNCVKFWGELGFLEGLDEHISEILAVAFDNMAYCIINDDVKVENIKWRTDDNWPDIDFDTVIFPILRVVVSEIGDDFDFEKFLDYLSYYTFLSYNTDNIDESIDYEAEFVGVIGHTISRKFKRELKNDE